MQPITIAAWEKGLKNDTRPFQNPNDALTRFENAYVYRERILKRQGLRLLGRLQRDLTGQVLGMLDGSGNFSGNIVSILSLETNAEIAPGTLSISDGTNTYTDNGLGVLTGAPGGTGTIHYNNGALTISNGAAGGTLTAAFDYYPTLPVMGISQFEIAAINSTTTVFFDTKYAYIYSAGFEEWIVPGVTWDGTDSDFFWTTNYRGANPQDRLFFVTNNVKSAGSPMRYTNGATWTTFAPLVSATNTLFEAAILIPYYGRLLALNCTEGTTAGGIAGAVNVFNRCRASAIGSPIAADSWRTDIFGQGIVIDAPTNESIIGTTFIKNTLIVEFERSHWELRYVGEYGIPFIWERVSADFGSESQWSGVTFDNASLIVGSTAILAANAAGVRRIDEDIPDTVFNMRNAEDGTKRIIGARDYQKELVYWCYVDSDFQELTTQLYPQKVLVYNYRNGSFSQFRQNVTFMGQFQTSENITWSSTNILWDDETVYWDDVKSQSLFPNIVCGNQQGFISYFNEQIPDDPSQTITAIDRTVTPVVITSPNHNYVTGDIIQFVNIVFSDGTNPITTDLNNRFFQVTFIDLNTFSISEWDFVNEDYVDDFSYIPASGTGTYVGGGQIILYPKMLIETKDFNPWLEQLKQVKLIRIDFLLDVNESANVTVMASPSSTAFDASGVLGNFQVETYDPSSISEYAEYLWHRFYLTMNGQFARIRLTYDDNLMNTASTHAEPFVLNAMTIWLRPGGSSVLR